MAIVINEKPTNNIPLVGCGLKVEVEEDAYVNTAGAPSDISISFNLTSNITAGDTFTLHGIKFTFVTSGSVTNAQEIALGSPLSTTYLNVENTLNSFPFFAANYNITNNAADLSVQLQAKIDRLDPNFGYSFDTANANAIEIAPTTTPTAGIDPDIKEDYVFLIDIFDFNAIDFEPLLCQPLAYNPSVDTDLNATACIFLEQILKDLGIIYTAPPLPRQTVAQGADLPTNFDPNYAFRFEISIRGEYQNPNGETCDRILSLSNSFNFTAYNLVQPLDYQEVQNYFEDIFFGGLVGGGGAFLTAMPSDYKICKYTPFELRYYLPMEQINSAGGTASLNISVNYSDGSSAGGIFSIEDFRNGVHVANISLDDDTTPRFPNSTVPVNGYADKRPTSVEVSITYIYLGSPYTQAERTIYIDNDSKGKCCDGCQKTFYFLSTLGNNDVIVARCERQIDLDVSFYDTCREVECGGDDYFGVPQFDGGRVQTQVEQRQKVYSVYFDLQDADYLDEFISSPRKYVYEDDKVYRIVPTETSYQIFTKNGRNIMEFTYYKSIDVLDKRLTK